MSKVRFNNKDHSFLDSIKREADAYFTSNRLRPTGNWKLYIKAILFISLAITIYFFLLTGNYSPLVGLMLCVLLALCLSGIAMNVMHDACHGSFSQHRSINRIMGLSMNALGSNAFLWKIKHNVLHHTYTNINEVDNDIANWPLLRQSPDQKWLPVHRYQYIYMYLLYAVTTIHWMLYFDFEKYFTRRFTVTVIRKISGREHFLFWFSKILYGVFYFFLPIYFLGWQYWLVGFITLHIVMGLTVTIIFQLAHVVEKTEFEASVNRGVIENEWAIHEVRTTANFAQDNKILNWYIGGLNFQVEHHLFPQVSHVHYPALSKIVRKQCALFGLPYNSYESLADAVVSHTKFMRKLGKIRG